MASPSVPPYFSILLFIFCNSGCVNPERNKASSVTFISSRPLSSRSAFPIADCASNHTDEFYSNPHDVYVMYQISDNRSHNAPLVVQPTSVATSSGQPGWFSFAKVISDQIRLSEGSHLIRVLVYLSERERSAGRTCISCAGTFTTIHLFTQPQGHTSGLNACDQSVRELCQVCGFLFVVVLSRYERWNDCQCEDMLPCTTDQSRDRCGRSTMGSLSCTCKAEQRN